MSGCCCTPGFELFGEKTARRDLRRYRRKGLAKTAQEIVELLRQRGVEGATLLEVGGGIGALQVELVRAGAAGALGVDASGAYDEAAGELLRETGLEGRVERRTADFVASAATLAPADFVVMHRVVCCYPDADGLVAAAAKHTRRLLVFTFPRDTWLSRLVFRGSNLWFRAIGWGFRIYVHRPAAMLAVAQEHGLRLVDERRGLVWQTAALEVAT